MRIRRNRTRTKDSGTRRIPLRARRVRAAGPTGVLLGHHPHITRTLALVSSPDASIFTRKSACFSPSRDRVTSCFAHFHRSLLLPRQSFPQKGQASGIFSGAFPATHRAEFPQCPHSNRIAEMSSNPRTICFSIVTAGNLRSFPSEQSTAASEPEPLRSQFLVGDPPPDEAPSSHLHLRQRVGVPYPVTARELVYVAL